MKLLLTGKNGQVGFELQRSLAPLGEIVAVDLAECDLSSPEAIRQLVRDTRPDVIVNPAAYTAVDKAETDRERGLLRSTPSHRAFLAKRPPGSAPSSSITPPTTSSTAPSRAPTPKPMPPTRKAFTA